MKNASPYQISCQLVERLLMQHFNGFHDGGCLPSFKKISVFNSR